MELRHLGQTDLLVSRLGLGLAALGRPGYINLGHADDLKHSYDVAVMEKHAHTVLDAAWDLGIRYFDAARSYGRAESFLASWLADRKIDPAAVTVGSKWGYTYSAAWKIEAEKHEVKDHSLAVLHRQGAESRGLLGSHLKLYQIHSATLDSGVLEDRAVLEELARLRSSGWKIGLSLSGPKQAATLHKALTVTIDGARVFDCVQATWNLLEPSAGPALEAAHKVGMGVIVKEALANGRLTPRNREPAFTAQRQLLEASAQRLQTTLDALSMAAVLAQPWVDVALSGAATVKQLQSNVAAVRVAWDVQAERELHSVAESPQDYWQTRSGLAWN